MNSEKYRKEVKDALESDAIQENLLGKVWELTYSDKKTPKGISEVRGTATSGFVYNYRRYLNAILNGEIPKAPTLAKQTESALRSFRKRHQRVLSEETEQKLKKCEDECRRNASNSDEVERENSDLESETERRIREFEGAKLPGVYLYTYPRYLSAPIRESTDDSSMRTYLKIGKSKKNARNRILQQTTGMPEPPKILEIWVIESDDEVDRVESKIKDHLHVIGHGIPGSKREWFLTNEETVVSTANLIGLKRFDDHENENTTHADTDGG